MVGAAAVTLITVVIVLIAFILKRWTLGRRFGAVLVCGYFLYLLAAVLVEVFSLSEFRLKTCVGDF